MSHTLTYIKSFVAFIIVWFTDAFVLKFADISLFGPEAKEIISECKDIVSLIASVVIVILTIVRINNEAGKKKDLKDNEQK